MIAVKDVLTGFAYRTDSHIIKIGSGPENALILPDPHMTPAEQNAYKKIMSVCLFPVRISQEHAQLYDSNGRIYLVDRKSPHGVYIDIDTLDCGEARILQINHKWFLANNDRALNVEIEKNDWERLRVLPNTSYPINSGTSFALGRYPFRLLDEEMWDKEKNKRFMPHGNDQD